MPTTLKITADKSPYKTEPPLPVGAFSSKAVAIEELEGEDASDGEGEIEGSPLR